MQPLGVGRQAMLLTNFTSGSKGLFQNMCYPNEFGFDSVRNHWYFYFARILTNCFYFRNLGVNKSPEITLMVEGRPGPIPGLPASCVQPHSIGLSPASHSASTQGSTLKLSCLLKHQALSWFEG